MSAKAVSKHFLNCKEESASAVFIKIRIFIFFFSLIYLGHKPRNLASHVASCSILLGTSLGLGQIKTPCLILSFVPENSAWLSSSIILLLG